MICPSLNATQIGTVGEQLVRYKLLRWGYQAIAVEQGNDYDLLILADKPIRLQVKSTKAPEPSKPNIYRFSTRKGSYNTDTYCKSMIDGFAFVSLDNEKVIFNEVLTTKTKRFHKCKFLEVDEHQSWLSLLDKLGAS